MCEVGESSLVRLVGVTNLWNVQHSALVPLCLLLGFMIARVRLLLRKQRDSRKLVKLNRTFSIKFMVLTSDGLCCQ